jgi:cyclic pyranopterin phosphate synthase
MVQLGVNHVRITGGEPLLRNGITKLIKAISELPGVEDLSMTTNAYLLGSMAKPLKDSGLHRINISLDSLNRERFHQMTRLDCLDRVLRGIDTAIEVGFHPIKVNAVIVRGFNDGEVMDFVRFAMERPIEMRFIEFMPIGPETSWNENHVVPSAELRNIIQKEVELIPIERKDRTSPADTFRIPGSKGNLGFISPLTEHFCADCNRFRLSATGGIRTCLFNEEDVNIREAIRKYKEDDEVIRLLFHAADLKPEKHEPDLQKLQQNSAYMSQIGG